jgi:hypothetical protein
MKTRMFSIRTFTLVLFATITLSNPVHAQSPVELIVNGGFETGDLTGWSSPVPNPNPWSVSNSLPHMGNYSAYNPALGSATAAPTLYQTFLPTPVSGISTAGLWYYHPGGAPGTIGFAAQLVFSDGTKAQDFLFASDPNYQVNVWAYRDLRPTLVEFPDKQLVGIGFFPKAGGSQFVDDVSVVGIPIVPEPSTAILGCLGLLFYWFGRIKGHER